MIIITHAPILAHHEALLCSVAFVCSVQEHLVRESSSEWQIVLHPYARTVLPPEQQLFVDLYTKRHPRIIRANNQIGDQL